MTLSLFFDKLINETINIDQVISIFFGSTKPFLMSESEMPNIRFVFPVHYYELLGHIVEKTPIIKDRTGYNPNRDNVEAVYKEKDNPDIIPIINVTDPKEFFTCLLKITEAFYDYKEKFDYGSDIIELSEVMQKYIWLRMGKNDFNDVISFLKRQEEFLRDTTLDGYLEEQKVGDYYDYEILAKQTWGHSYDETYKKIQFTFANGTKRVHQLPVIDYGICEEDGKKVCYIYAIQNTRYLRDKKVERKLYKLNKGVENPEHHPNFVMAMKLFIDLVQKEGVNEIRIPDGQVLSHRFHEIMGDNAKRHYEERYGKYDLEDILKKNELVSEYAKINHIINMGYYQRLVGKADFIENAKTTKLISLLNRIAMQFPDYEIMPREEDVDYTSLNIKTKTYKK